MNGKQLAIASAVVAAVLVVIVVLLATGTAPPGEEARDAAGDVEIGEGEAAPEQIALADIREAKVREVASQIVFEAAMGAAIPLRLKGQTMEWRWEISEGGEMTWLVNASISVGRPIASVLEQRSGGYSASTVDDTLAGGIDYDGNTIFVRLNRAEIPNFPDRFTWRLETTLDADRADPSSATATDEAPASGLGEYPPGG